MGGSLRPAFEEIDVQAMLRQANDDELRRLQLEQARLEQRKSKEIKQGYISNQPKKTDPNGTTKPPDPGVTTDLSAELGLEIASWIYGAKEAMELIKLLKYLKIPLKVFLHWLKEEIKRKGLKESLEELAKVSKNTGISWGGHNAKQVIQRTIRGVDVKFPADQVKAKVMKHLKDFDWKKPFREKDLNEILEHLVQKISQADIVKVGTWRKKPCIHFYDSNTGVVYIIMKEGNVFETFFKLAPKQVEWLVKTGDLS